ncbi:hypothetical protein [Fortiea contorta]|uniref:hypothetical protein n=1 Tax=Fortiea contorta TaxID=1892405 RepID=UPI000348A762|nr:hypothetical protein [Fortiea contorta]
MSKALIQDIFSNPEEWEETALPATDKDLLVLTERLLEFEIPTQVFFQAIAIAAYDSASAFRYFDNYLATTKKKNKIRNLLLSRSRKNFENN